MHPHDTERRLSFWRGVFYLLVSIGLALTVVRFTKGLGAVTNLSDHYPWGLWKAFNVLAGVGLGGAGFTIMATVYIFNSKRFRPIVRPAVLMAFLAYFSAAFALFIDIGRPWTIWHPVIMWNPSSVLFDVAWCLMLYTTVLILEGSGMVFEKLGWNRMVTIQRVITLPIVAIGVILSTLHQSSLGSLFLIVPGKLHTLWYTPRLPVLFFLSAIGMGLALVIVLSRLSARAFGRRLELPLLADLGRILVGVLGIYFVARVFDLGYRGVLGTAFGFSYESLMFLVEFLLGVVVPGVMLANPRLRRNIHGLYAASLMVIFGFIANRLNVSITGFESAQGGHYVPSVSEVFITLMIIALAFAAFRIAARVLGVYPDVHGPAVLTDGILQPGTSPPTLATGTTSAAPYESPARPGTTKVAPRRGVRRTGGAR